MDLISRDRETKSVISIDLVRPLDLIRCCQCLTIPLGSMSIILHSVSAYGLCSTPFGRPQLSKFGKFLNKIYGIHPIVLTLLDRQ